MVSGPNPIYIDRARNVFACATANEILAGKPLPIAGPDIISSTMFRHPTHLAVADIFEALKKRKMFSDPEVFEHDEKRDTTPIIEASEISLTDLSNMRFLLKDGSFALIRTEGLTDTSGFQDVLDRLAITPAP